MIDNFDNSLVMKRDAYVKQKKIIIIPPQGIPRPKSFRQMSMVQVAMLPSRIRPLISRHVLPKPLCPSRPFSSSSSFSSTSLSPSTGSPPPDANGSSFAADPPPSSSPHHHSLSTFLSYAARTSLSATSPVYVGTYYEYLCLSTLPRLGFALVRTGGRADCGIDLLGRWRLPSLPYPLRVLVQCKATKAKPAPERIRELEGAVAGAPDGWRGPNTVGVLCAKQAATRGVRDAVRRCGIPVVWVMLEEDEGRGRVRQVLWNEKVAAMGAEGVGVGVRYVIGNPHRGEEAIPPAAAAPREGMEKEAVLLWEGREWDPGVNETEEPPSHVPTPSI